MKEVTTNSVAETIDLGAKIGGLLKGGEVLAVTGNLGAGKTHFIKGIVRGIGGSEAGEVCSPTFVLVKEYLDGRLDVYHIDAYRLESDREFENLGFDDMCTPASVVLIEWADKVRGALKNVTTIEVRIDHNGENSRKIMIEGLEF